MAEVERFRDDPSRRQLYIVGEPGRGKTAFVSYLANLWNCPRFFVRVGNTRGVIGADARACFVSIGQQLFERYGSAIFAKVESTTSVRAGWVRDHAEVIGRMVDELYTFSFLSPAQASVEVRVGVATGGSRVIGERVARLVDVTLALDPLTLLHAAVLDPIRRMANLYPDERVTLLVDALDESRQHAGEAIGDLLPRADDAEFPPNLRLIATSRPGGYSPDIPARDILDLEDKRYQGAQRQDVERYIRHRLGDPAVREALALQLDQRVAAFVETLARHSDGNFLYLYHMLNELVAVAADGALQLDEMPIPAGLDEVYRVFAVERIRRSSLASIRFTLPSSVRDDQADAFVALLRQADGIRSVSTHGGESSLFADDISRGTAALVNTGIGTGVVPTIDVQSVGGSWESAVLPVVGTLAVAFDALTREQIALYAGVDAVTVENVVDSLRSFLNEQVDQSADRYRLYHSSFSDYLLDPRRNRDFALDARTCHERVARHMCTGMRCSEVDWTRLSDRYVYTHLAAHLEASGNFSELHALLSAETPEHLNAWYVARIDDPGGYLDDVRRARRTLDTSIATHGELSLACRYTLMESSLRSLAHNVPPEMLGALVRHTIWTVDRAEAYALAVSDADQRVRSLIQLVPFVDAEQLDRCIAAIRAALRGIDFGGRRADHLVGLLKGCRQPVPPSVRDSLMEWLPQLDPASRAWPVAIEAADRLAAEDLPAVLSMVERMGAPPLVRMSVARRLTEGRRQAIVDDVLAASGVSDEPFERCARFLALAPYVPQSTTRDMLRQLVADAWRLLLAPDNTGVSDNPHHMDRMIGWSILRDILPHLASAEQQETVAVLLEHAADAPMDGPRTMFPALAEHVEAPAREHILSCAHAIVDHVERIDVLATLVPLLDESQQESVIREVMEAVLARPGQLTWLTDNLDRIGPRLPTDVRSSALEVARAAQPNLWRGRALLHLAAMFDGEEREAVLEEVVKTAAAVRMDDFRPTLIADAAPVLSPACLRRALTLVESIGDEVRLAPHLADLFADLPEPNRIKLWRAGLDASAGDESARLAFLIRAAPLLDPEVRLESIDVARAIGVDSLRAQALAAVAVAPGALLAVSDPVVVEIENALNAGQNQPLIAAKCFLGLANLVAPGSRAVFVERALAEMRRLPTIEDRAPLLSVLLPLLPEERCAEIVVAELSAPQPYRRGRYVIPKLAAHLPLDFARWIFMQTSNMRKYDMDSWVRLLRHMTFPLPSLGFSIDDQETGYACGVVGKRLCELGDAELVLDLLTARVDENTQAWELSTVVPELPRSLAEQAISRALMALESGDAQATHEDPDRVVGSVWLFGESGRDYVAARLCPSLAALGEHQRAADLARSVHEPGWRAEALLGIAAHVAPGRRRTLLDEVLPVIQEVRDESTRRRRLGEFAALASTAETDAARTYCWRVLFALAGLPRDEAISGLCAVGPLLSAGGGHALCEAAVDALIDVTRWWP